MGQEGGHQLFTEEEAMKRELSCEVWEQRSPGVNQKLWGCVARSDSFDGREVKAELRRQAYRFVAGLPYWKKYLVIHEQR